ncbi:DUF2264 domain-containing protein [Paludibaculum fermentans]|uniref:DUF2264 domain-containing protein n=1 Tax=Paludibaculum fermentans TaxID=1473598 RepID=A0A7S7NL43_PALFE|nr:DUF2264 domain-containing protein [Paludibaculum fermentans]QOY85588.1 DUF2264 domain-containing protein [Paludibaculum fermentans]
MTRRDLFGTVALAGVLSEESMPAVSGEFYLPWLNALVKGYLTNAKRTSDSLAVCDFEGGSKRPDGLSRSGKTYCSVSRMLPALAACVMAGRDAEGVLFQAILSVYRHAFDPEHRDYWGPSPAEKPDLRQVESSLVAWTLWLLRDRLPGALTVAERENVQRWLASCTVREVRYNNFAWFTAVNQAVRLALSERWSEFHGDEAWMLDDLRAMDAMYAGDGWYTDGKGTHIHDYYSFWVFASHYLYWREIIGAKYPEWNSRFEGRVKQLMLQAPELFSASGAHAMMGVSLVYRFAVLTALVLAYRQGLWPHSAGLLRGLVRRNMAFFWGHGAFDGQKGKLRETISEVGTPEFAESYIDNGHPYWGMQAFAFLLIPRRDAFWTEREEELPCEKRDFVTALAGPGVLISGCKSTGESRLHFVNNGRFDAIYRDRYTKFSYSGQLFFCFTKRKDRATWDSALVFRDPASGLIAGRAGVEGGRLVDGGYETEWWAVVEGIRIRVRSRIRPDGDREFRSHVVEATESAIARKVEIWEGSAALPFAENEQIEIKGAGQRLAASAPLGRVGVTEYSGYDEAVVESRFEPVFGRENIHLFAPRCAVLTLKTVLRQPVTALSATFLCRPARGKGGVA